MSRLFLKLQRAVSRAEKNFIHSTSSGNIFLSERDYYHANAFCMMCHAEIEEYIEEIVRHTAKKNFQRIRNGKGKQTFVIHILGWYVFEHLLEPDKISYEKLVAKYNKGSLFDILDDCQTSLNTMISKNHGIREENLKRLLCPLGIDLSMLDQSWLNDMDSFGKLRGGFAHKGFGIQRSIDPQESILKVNALLTGLKILDKRLCSL